MLDKKAVRCGQLFYIQSKMHQFFEFDKDKNVADLSQLQNLKSKSFSHSLSDNF